GHGIRISTSCRRYIRGTGVYGNASRRRGTRTYDEKAGRCSRRGSLADAIDWGNRSWRSCDCDCGGKLEDTRPTVPVRRWRLSVDGIASRRDDVAIDIAISAKIA